MNIKPYVRSELISDTKSRLSIHLLNTITQGWPLGAILTSQSLQQQCKYYSTCDVNLNTTSLMTVHKTHYGFIKVKVSVYILLSTCCMLLPRLWILSRPLTVLYCPTHGLSKNVSKMWHSLLNNELQTTEHKCFHILVQMEHKQSSTARSDIQSLWSHCPH